MGRAASETDKRGAGELSAADQRPEETCALHAGIAIDNARLRAQAGRAAGGGRS
jgi:hypothetical protein